MLALAADAGPFAALGGQHVGVAGMGVAPAQAGLEFAGQHGVAGMIRAGRHAIRYNKVSSRAHGFARFAPLWNTSRAA